MIKQKLKNLIVITILLSSVFLLASFSVKTAEVPIVEKTNDGLFLDHLLKRTFLFGRIQHTNHQDDYSTLEAVNLRIIFFKPFQVFHFTSRETITFSNQYKGIMVLDSFVMGSFTVVLPINNNSIAVMNTTMGTIVLELYEDKTPMTTANFIKLANDGFYEGLVFHRVVDNFVIQGGGYYPNGTLKISPYGPIDLETHPDVRHLDGTIGMARTSDPNSATSQFFINDGAQPHLNPGGVDPNGYAAFGRVVKGIEVVRAIVKVETMTKYGFMNDWPVVDVIITSVTIVPP